MTVTPGPDPAHEATVRIEFTPYAHHQVRDFLGQVRRDFGNPGRTRRWYFTSVDLEDEPSSRGWINAWCLNFYFVDARDATLFALKYQR